MPKFKVGDVIIPDSEKYKGNHAFSDLIGVVCNNLDTELTFRTLEIKPLKEKHKVYTKNAQGTINIMANWYKVVGKEDDLDVNLFMVLYE